MASSVTSSLLNFIYLISLPSSVEQAKELETLAKNEKELISKIFNKDTYERLRPSAYPTEIAAFMLIDHIEELDQKQQVMVMHCTVIVSWTDSRIRWEPRDYGSVDKIVRGKSLLSGMWFPPIHFTELTMRGESLMQYYNTETSITYHGLVLATVSLSIRTTCTFDFSDYPNDVQRCYVTMFTPYPLSKLKFSEQTFSGLRTRDRYGSVIGKTTLRAGEFVVVNTSAKTLYVFLNNTSAEKPTSWPPDVVTSVIRFEVVFERRTYYYKFSIALPLFCIAAISYLAATVVNPAVSLIWLLMCIVVQIMNYTQMVEKLPPDHQMSTPVCAIMAEIIFSETAVLLFFRIVMTHFYSKYAKDAARILIMQRIELAMQILVGVHCLINAFILFS